MPVALVSSSELVFHTCVSSAAITRLAPDPSSQLLRERCFLAASEASEAHALSRDRGRLSLPTLSLSSMSHHPYDSLRADASQRTRSSLMLPFSSGHCPVVIEAWQFDLLSNLAKMTTSVHCTAVKGLLLTLMELCFSFL